MSEASALTTSSESMSSLEDSRANLGRQRERAVDKVTSGGSGPSSLEFCASFDPRTSCWKTSQGCLPSATEVPSEKFSEIWPRSGTMRGGIVSPLPTSARLNAASGSGSSPGWPTPTTTDVDANRGWSRKDETYPGGKTTTSSLVEAIDRGLWPTAIASDWYPAPPGPTQYDWEPPRTTKEWRLRRQRLKALGNAVVPQCAQIAGEFVVELDRKRQW